MCLEGVFKLCVKVCGKCLKSVLQVSGRGQEESERSSQDRSGQVRTGRVETGPVRARQVGTGKLGQESWDRKVETGKLGHVKTEQV